MRKLFLTMALLSVVVLLTHGAAPSPAYANEVCTATCQEGATLTCTVASGTCSSASGSVTCCGSTHTCTAINAWDTCMTDCQNQFTTCLNDCPNHTIDPCLLDCENALQTCKTHCGAEPPVSFSC